MKPDDLVDYYLKKGILLSPELEVLEQPAPQSNVTGPVQEEQEGSVEIVRSYSDKAGSRSVQDFVNYFNLRYKSIDALLRGRQELQNTTAIKRLLSRKEREQATIICMILEKNITKNKNILLTVEDQTGHLTVLISKNKRPLYDMALTLCLDDIIGISGTYEGILYADTIILPDIPLNKEFKKSPIEEVLVVISDLHIGSKKFMEKEFLKFIDWLSGNVGKEEQRHLASKTRYLFIVGDLIEGVGIYPDQEKDLNITDVYKQYAKLAEYLQRLPQHIHIIISPGNHDVGRLSEPQPKLFKDFAKPLYDLPNVHLVSNPAYVNIGKTAAFPGFDVLLYHGGSLIYYSEEVEHIRAAGGQKRVDLVMKHLLQRRHLAPAHNATLYVPYPDKDPLLIDIVPDFFITGHIHRAIITTYRNVMLVNSSGWVANTEYQDKRGLEPQLGRAMVFNLKTREAKTLNFLEGNA
ncbi:MAG: metallophosphoesterase [archaeon]